MHQLSSPPPEGMSRNVWGTEPTLSMKPYTTIKMCSAGTTRPVWFRVIPEEWKTKQDGHYSATLSPSKPGAPCLLGTGWCKVVSSQIGADSKPFAATEPCSSPMAGGSSASDVITLSLLWISKSGQKDWTGHPLATSVSNVLPARVRLHIRHVKPELYKKPIEIQRIPTVLPETLNSVAA